MSAQISLSGYCRTGGALLGQGEVGCAGEAVMGAAGAAADAGRAGFFGAGFLAGGFLATFGAGAAGESSTTTGLGPSLGESPDD